MSFIMYTLCVGKQEGCIQYRYISTIVYDKTGFTNRVKVNPNPPYLMCFYLLVKSLLLLFLSFRPGHLHCSCFMDYFTSFLWVHLSQFITLMWRFNHNRRTFFLAICKPRTFTDTDKNGIFPAEEQTAWQQPWHSRTTSGSTSHLINIICENDHLASIKLKVFFFLQRNQFMHFYAE